ncbi:carbohydrate ABC transporter permease [Aureimonas leprariae]|uniref:Sugar ABC transporter permease n=1 Tax=Plantimonas leprariae TaxID=2615207 RepID=A0A7V7PMV7_9HYPH|nr:sugar ABC transporter permease [Aureimonas leprariae]KAB0678546.1 sugar ABC transporter permease [Aureimonas leprariae]
MSIAGKACMRGRAAAAGRKAAVPRRRVSAFPYLLVAPYLALFAVFLGYPIVRAFWISLFDWGIFGPNAFVGAENYLSLFGDGRFWRSFRTTAAFALIYVPMIMVISTVLAALLHRKLPGIAAFRTIVFFPLVVNVAVASIAFKWLFEPEAGTINQFLRLLHLPDQTFLSQPGWALFAVSLVALWINVGFMVIIILAGLENIPDDLYEAATLDGSTPVGSFFHITLPLLRPVLLVVLVLSLIQAFQVFGEVLIMTDGGPFQSTEVLTMLLYEEGFRNFALGRASAIGVVITMVIAALSLVQFRLFRER